MPTLIITVDLQCCRCNGKMQKIICCIQESGEFVIEKVVFEKDKVLVTGPFDADKLTAKLLCKAGNIIKKIETKKEEKEKEKEKEKTNPPACKLFYPYPYPYGQYPYKQPGGWPCSCPTPHCGCQYKPPPAPAPEPPKPPPPCQCPTWASCHRCGYPPYMPSPMPYPLVVCEDNNPPYGACSVM